MNTGTATPRADAVSVAGEPGVRRPDILQGGLQGGHHDDPRSAERRARRAIALFEAAKGAAAFAGGVGLLSLVHYDVRHLANELVGHFGWNPTSRYPAIFLHYADVLEDANLRTIMAIVAAYILIRFVEAFGLWRDRAWAEWLGAVSGGIYVPFELKHFIAHPTVINFVILAINVVVVVFLAWQLWRRRGRQDMPAAA
jgi:uncharacterized membrane protein (DUF2068 family)